LALAAVACDPAVEDAPPSPRSAQESPSPSASPSAAAPVLVPSGACANDYFPVVPDTTWLYLRTIDERSNRFRQTVEEITDSGFVMLLQFGNAGERDFWTCSPDGLANVEQYVTGPSGGAPPPDTIPFGHFRSQGVSVPADISVGSSWKQVVTSLAFFTVNGVRHRERQVITTSYRAVAEETVATPMGVFDSLKIETTSTTHKTAPTFGNGIDQTTTSVFTQWWSRGVGLVKLSSDTSSGTIVLLDIRTK
jgi:hypothetical protein